MYSFGKARFFEEDFAPGKARCWTSAWRRTQSDVMKEVSFSRWIGETFEVKISARGDLMVAAEEQNPRVIASPKKPVAQLTPAALDELRGAERSTPNYDRTATGMSILQSEAWRHENKVRNEQALAAVVGLALFGDSRSMPRFYVDDSGNLPSAWVDELVDDSGNLPSPTPKFDHTALKAEWKERSTGTNAAWWTCEVKDGGDWYTAANPYFYDFDEYRIVKSEHHPDVIRGKVKAEYEALCKSGEIKHWDVEIKRWGVEFKGTTTRTWKKCPDPSWLTHVEYRLVKRDTHPDVVREQVRVEWEAREEEIANGKPLRAVRLEYKNTGEPDTEWRPCNFPVWHKGSEYRIIYLTPKKLIDMSAMPAGTNTTVGKIVGHHLFQKPGSVFALAEGATHVQEWQAEDVDLVEKQDWVKWEAKNDAKCPFPPGVKVSLRHAGGREIKPCSPFGWLWDTQPNQEHRIVAFKILGAEEGYTFNAKEAS